MIEQITSNAPAVVGVIVALFAFVSGFFIKRSRNSKAIQASIIDEMDKATTRKVNAATATHETKVKELEKTESKIVTSTDDELSRLVNGAFGND